MAAGFLHLAIATYLDLSSQVKFFRILSVMPRPSLSHLYFETTALSKAPLKWLLCGAFIHAGLFCIPTGNFTRHDHGIVFRQGNAGIEVELLAESPESAPAEAVDSSDSSPDSVAQPLEPDSVIVEMEDATPAKPASSTIRRPTQTKSDHVVGRTV